MTKKAYILWTNLKTCTYPIIVWSIKKNKFKKNVQSSCLKNIIFKCTTSPIFSNVASYSSVSICKILHTSNENYVLKVTMYILTYKLCRLVFHIWDAWDCQKGSMLFSFSIKIQQKRGGDFLGAVVVSSFSWHLSYQWVDIATWALTGLFIYLKRK